MKTLIVCSVVEPAFTRCNICDAKGKKWSVKQQQNGNCSSSKHKEEASGSCDHASLM